jgi:hypothetical protein
MEVRNKDNRVAGGLECWNAGKQFVAHDLLFFHHAHTPLLPYSITLALPHSPTPILPLFPWTKD